MSKVSIENTLAVHGQKTYLSSGVAAAAVTSGAKNTTGFTTQYAIQIGETGQDQTEVVIGTVASGTSFTHPALAFDHPADTPIYDIKFNQVVFEKSTAGTAGTAAPITNGTVSYKPDNWDSDLQLSLTIFDDTSGASTDAYKTMFRNSVLGSNSSESDWVTPAGNSFYSLAALTERVKAEMWNPTFIQDDNRIHNWINELKDNWTNSVMAVNQDFALGTTNVAFGTNGLGTITTADYTDVRRLWVTYNGVDKFQSTKQSVNDPIPGQVFSSSHPYHRWFGNTVFQVSPSDSAGTAELVFYRFGTTMVNETDELPHPFRSYTDAFVAYGVAKAAFLDDKLDKYDRKTQELKSLKQEFITNIVPRDRTGVQYVDIETPIDADDRGWR
jgi:hypothetical protein